MFKWRFGDVDVWDKFQRRLGTSYVISVLNHTCVFRSQAMHEEGPRSNYAHRSVFSDRIMSSPEYWYRIDRVLEFSLERPIPFPLSRYEFIYPSSPFHLPFPVSESSSMPALRKVPNTNSRPVCAFFIPSRPSTHMTLVT